MTDNHDVTIYRPSTVHTRIGNQLAGWLAADMLALCDLLDVTEPDVLRRDEVTAAAQKLLRSVQAALTPTETD